MYTSKGRLSRERGSKIIQLFNKEKRNPKSSLNELSINFFALGKSEE